MNTNTISLPHAKDLMQQPPRSPRLRLDGYVIMARMIDKGRATLNGTNGEYHFNCPVDNMLFGFKGVAGEEVRKLLLSGATDEQVAEWFDTHGTPKSPAEITAWSDQTERFSYSTVPEKKEWFGEECRRLRLDPAKASLFDYLEADDRDSHRL